MNRVMDCMEEGGSEGVNGGVGASSATPVAFGSLDGAAVEVGVWV